MGGHYYTTHSSSFLHNNIALLHHNSHTTRTICPHSPHSPDSPHSTSLHCIVMAGSSIYTGGRPSISDSRLGMRKCCRQFDAEMKRQKSVRDTEGSQITRERSEAAAHRRTLPWAQGYVRHLRNYLGAAADAAATESRPPTACDNFGAKLKQSYDDVDECRTAYYLAEDRGPTETEDAIFDYIRKPRMAASVSLLPDLDDPGLIVLIHRHEPSHQSPQYRHLVPHRCPLSSRLPSPPIHQWHSANTEENTTRNPMKPSISELQIATQSFSNKFLSPISHLLTSICPDPIAMYILS